MRRAYVIWKLEKGTVQQKNSEVRGSTLVRDRQTEGVAERVLVEKHLNEKDLVNLLLAVDKAEVCAMVWSREMGMIEGSAVRNGRELEGEQRRELKKMQ